MERIIERLKKILALSERGEQNEARNARMKLERELKKHGLTIEDIVSEKKCTRVFRYKNKDETVLFMRILIRLYGIESEEVKECRYNARKKLLIIDLSDFQYFDILSMYSFHCKQFAFEKEKITKNIISAYINKHDLFDYSQNKSDVEDAQDIDIEKIKSIVNIANSMDDTFYHKSLKG